MDKPFRVLFMGTSDFAVPALEALHSAGYMIPLVVTQPDRPAGRGLELKESPIKKKALQLQLPVFQPEKIKSPDAGEILQTAAPDVAVVTAYGQILPASVLQLPKLACLNIHGSILPKYRGAAPIHYAVMNGEKETGVTIMYMNEKMDEGDALLVKKTPIGAQENTGEVHDRLAKLGAEGLMEALELLKQGKAPRQPQDSSQASYAPSLKREQGFIHWDKPAREIANQVRGLSPWPVAETKWKEMELKVHVASAEPSFAPGKAPGQVLYVGKEGLKIVAGDHGIVLLKEIQPPGKRRMSAYEFSIGHPQFGPGEMLS